MMCNILTAELSTDHGRMDSVLFSDIAVITILLRPSEDLDVMPALSAYGIPYTARHTLSSSVSSRILLPLLHRKSFMCTKCEMMTRSAARGYCNIMSTNAAQNQLEPQ